IGNGGYGVVAAFVRLNANDNILERVAIKDTVLSPAEFAAEHAWAGHPAPPGGPSLLREVGAMRALENSDCQNLVKLIGWNVYPGRNLYRLELEYCSHGDLFHGPWRRYHNAREPIPEPAIWAILYGLVEACVVLEQGHTDTPLDGWQPIVHRDFKLDNVFLGDFLDPAEDPDSPFPTYPIPKLGDFGFALQLDDADAAIPDPTHSGTDYYAAPEQMQGQNRWLLTTKTNVFGIGIIALALMSRKQGNAPVTLAAWQKGKGVYFPASTRSYSQELRDIVKRCLYKTAAKRPSVLELRELLEENCCGPDDKASGLYNVFESQRAKHRTGEFELLGLPADAYAIGPTERITAAAVMAAPLTDAQKHTLLQAEIVAGGHWSACRPLGQGSYGVVGVAVRHDANQTIIERCAVKDCYYQDDNHWASHLTWTGAPAPPSTSMMREMGAMEAVQPALSRNIVAIRGSNLRRDLLRYRLLMEYCPRTDLWGSWWHYKRAAGQSVPEPALWSILWGLMEACVVLEQGHPTVPQPGWEPIVHRDMKLDNIMLGNYPLDVPDNAAPFRLYSIPKLGDFGFAVQIDPANPPLTPGLSGAHGYQAVEQMTRHKQWRLSSKTNVFGIGIMVLSLMALSEDCAPKTLKRWKEVNMIHFPRAALRYSTELRDVVKQCVAKLQANRPSLAQLRVLLDTHCCGPEDRARGMYHLFPGQVATHRGGQLDLIGVPPARYAVGTQFV
ncbi:hypothetical protein LTR95_016412, partial [Oleoguttula sp. CCFEE 5521]